MGDAAYDKANREIAADVLSQVRSGKFHGDIRDVGQLLTGRWDQDFPTWLLGLATKEAEATELRWRVKALEGLLEPFGMLADEYDHLDDEKVITLTYDDLSWGECVLGELFMRPFRKARAALQSSASETAEDSGDKAKAELNQGQPSKTLIGGGEDEG